MKPYLDLRRASQLYFILFYLVAGVFFYKAVTLLPTIGAEALTYRFPAVEAFLPISALLALKQWLVYGVWDHLHPAGLTILVLAILSALLFKRGFCSHLCPVGTVSELAFQLRLKAFPHKIRIHPFLHYALLTPKYLILGFFLYVIIYAMPAPAVVSFLQSPYNAVSDVKMLKFFTDPSALTLQVVAVLVVISLIIPNFWCRYLCPYGALLNLFAFLSPLALRRNASTCTNCKSCDRACPNGLTISTATAVTSTECTFCQSCIKACPHQSTLTIQSRLGSKSLTPLLYSSLVVGLFVAGIGAAKLLGRWESPLLGQLWVTFVPMLDTLVHP